MDLLSMEQMAAKLGYLNKRSLACNWKKKSLTNGMPNPVMAGKWDKEKVDAWLIRSQELGGKWDSSKVKPWLDRLRAERKWDDSTYRSWKVAFRVLEAEKCH